MKIKLNIGVVSEIKTTEVSDEVLKRATVETQWRLGVARIDGVERPVSRRIFLDEVQYRYKETLLANSCVESFMPTEYIFGRDDRS